jgi:hypothetical protein
VELITACCASRDRAFLALAEKCTSEARISIYDLRPCWQGAREGCKGVFLDVFVS